MASASNKDCKHVSIMALEIYVCILSMIKNGFGNVLFAQYRNF